MYGDRGGFRSSSNKASPVNVDDELEVTIEAVGKKGDGIAKKEGFVLFVPGGKKGERLRVKVTKVLPNVAFAESLGHATGSKNEDPEGVAEEEAEEETEETEEETEEDVEDSENFGEEE